MNCAVCGIDLNNNLSPFGNKPTGGTLEFIAQSQFGSTVFDPMDGSALSIIICDNCVKSMAKRNLVRLLTPVRHLEHIYSTWTGE